MPQADTSPCRDSARMATPNSAAHQRCAIFLRASHDSAIDAAEAAIDGGDVALARRLYSAAALLRDELETLSRRAG